MKKIFCILALSLLFTVACDKNNTNNDEPIVGASTSLSYTSESIADHNVVLVQPEDIEVTAPVVVVLADDLELATRTAESLDVNFKAAEHCLIGRYILCIVEAAKNDDLSVLTAVKSSFPNAKKFYLLSYRNGLAYTAAMQMPDEFAAFGCVSGAIDVAAYKVNNFTKPVSFVHVHATGNPECKWTGVENESVSVPLSIGAVIAVNECTHYVTTEILPREGKGSVSCTQYLGGLQNTDVKLYTVESANSGWCDAEFEVYNQIWNFFKTR